MRFSALISFFMTILLWTAASGAADADGGIKNELLEYLAKAEVYGLQAIGGRPLSQITSEIKNITMVLVPSIHRNSDETASYRATAEWERTTKTLKFSAYHYSNIRVEGRPCLTLHEVLGIVNIGDENFNKSAAVCSFVDFFEISGHHQHHVNPEMFPAMLELIAKAGGGSTGIEGGGDIRLLRYMQMLQTELMFALNYNRMDVRDFTTLTEFLSKLKIEFSDEIPQGHIGWLGSKKTILVPNNPTAGENQVVNAKTVQWIISTLKKDLDSGKLPR